LFVKKVVLSEKKNLKSFIRIFFLFSAAGLVISYFVKPANLLYSFKKGWLRAMETISNESRSGGNRLRFEKSPYLLQHADNPVDWYPWSEEAFEKAAREDKPVFLSIGYSTCHWCHVMEHESFEDSTVAAMLNDTFICIKVDREERPDIDNVYMTACQLLTGSGGWPLTVVMTPGKKPFFAGTYFPRESRFGRPGMLELIPRLQEVWLNRRQEVLESAERITGALYMVAGEGQGEELGEQELHTAFNQLKDRFDELHGGFSDAPKFPTPHNLSFLLRYWKGSGEKKALEMVEQTLSSMRRGGIFDHLGFGFHRYSTDRQWLAPHFEKMLYDQALLSRAYLEAYQATGNKDYAAVGREIFSYVLRDLKADEGAFFCAEDADSEGDEGRFYLWTEKEIRKVLNSREAEIALRVFNVQTGGNYADESTGQADGRNILHLQKGLSESAGEFDLEPEALARTLEKVREKLLAHREQRVHPGKDTKILTDWNGLMIASLAYGAKVLGDKSYAAHAKKAADFILHTMLDSRGRLLHRYSRGEAAILGNLDDYAFLVQALIELYEVDFELRYLEAAIELNQEMIERFRDETGPGGFYFTAGDAERLPVRRKEIYDGAVPSGNSIAALNLLRLGKITGNPGLEEKAAEIFRAFSGDIKKTPSAYTQLLSSLDFGLGPSVEVVVSGTPGKADTQAMLETLWSVFLPKKVVIFRQDGRADPPVTAIAAFTSAQTALDGRATAYVCLDYNCRMPTTDPAHMLRLIEESSEKWIE
jgi:uncharacterized protein